jgi:hypothetical protein
MVRETGYVKPGDDVKDIGVSQDFERSISSLETPNQIGPQTPIKGGFAIPMLVEKKEPRDATFEEVKEQVTSALKNERAMSQVEQAARNLASEIKAAGDIKATATQRGFEAKTADAFKLGSPIGEGGNPTGGTGLTDEAVYAMNAGDVTKTPIKVGDAWMIIGVTKRTEADPTEFAKQRDSLTETMLQQRQGQVFEDYIGNVEARMRREGAIKIYTDVLTRMEAEEPPAAAPPRMPQGFPQQLPITTK